MKRYSENFFEDRSVFFCDTCKYHFNITKCYIHFSAEDQNYLIKKVFPNEKMTLIEKAMLIAVFVKNIVDMFARIF